MATILTDSFTDTDGVEQVIATTQFEATDARRALG
jgi:hypothetical protein